MDVLIGDVSHELKPRCPEDFDPVPYNFRIPDSWKKTGESSVLSPPTWLLLDHTIAVVWYLFNSFSPGKMLDIDDLKWARAYLKEVRNPKGDNPPDVKTCLAEIEDRLIAQYAELPHKENAEERSRQKSNHSESDETIVIMKSAKASDHLEKERDLPRMKKEITKPEKEIPKGAIKSETFGTGTSVLKTNQKKTGATPCKRTTYGAGLKGTLIPTKRTELAAKETGKKQSVETSAESFLPDSSLQKNKSNDRMYGANNLAKNKINAVIRGALPNEGITQSNVKKDSIQRHSNDGKISLHLKKWINTDEHEEEAYKKLKNEIKELSKNGKISREEALTFLSDWRQDQMQRLCYELKKLSSIEELIKSYDMEGFVPYVTQNVAEKLVSLQKEIDLNVTYKI